MKRPQMGGSNLKGSSDSMHSSLEGVKHEVDMKGPEKDTIVVSGYNEIPEAMKKKLAASKIPRELIDQNLRLVLRILLYVYRVRMYYKNPADGKLDS